MNKQLHTYLCFVLIANISSMQPPSQTPCRFRLDLLSCIYCIHAMDYMVLWSTGTNLVWSWSSKNLHIIFLILFICSYVSETAYRSVSVAYSACCSGYGSHNCHGK